MNSSSSISSSQQQFGNFNALVSAAGADGFAWDNNTAFDSDDAAMSPITDTIAATADITSTARASAAASSLNLLADIAFESSSSSSSSAISSSAISSHSITIAGSDSKHPGRPIFTFGRPTQQGL
jgi:hypothetical protein